MSQDQYPKYNTRSPLAAEPPSNEDIYDSRDPQDMANQTMKDVLGDAVSDPIAADVNRQCMDEAFDFEERDPYSTGDGIAERVNDCTELWGGQY